MIVCSNNKEKHLEHDPAFMSKLDFNIAYDNFSHMKARLKLKILKDDETIRYKKQLDLKNSVYFTHGDLSYEFKYAKYPDITQVVLSS